MTNIGTDVVSENFPEFGEIAETLDAAVRKQDEAAEYGAFENQFYTSLRIYLHEWQGDDLVKSKVVRPDNIVVPAEYASNIAVGQSFLTEAKFGEGVNDYTGDWLELARAGYEDCLYSEDDCICFRDLITPVDFLRSLEAAEREGLDLYVLDMGSISGRAKTEEYSFLPFEDRKKNAEKLVKDLSDIAENLDSDQGSCWDEIHGLDGLSAVMVNRKDAHGYAGRLGEDVYTVPGSMPWRMTEKGEIKKGF